MSLRDPSEVQPAERTSEALIRSLDERHSDALMLWASRRFVDRREAEEVVQDTLLLAWRKWDQYDPRRGSERAWLFGILRNVAASHHRATRRQLRVVGDRPGIEASANADEAALVEAAHVADAVRSLSYEHRQVLVAAYYDGLLIRQIAHRLELAEGTVKSRLYYALRKLRAELEEREVLE